MNQAGIDIASTRRTTRVEVARPVGRSTLGLRMWLVPARHPSADIEIVVGVLGLAASVGLACLPLDWIVPWLGGCRFHDLTGHPCPTCGITRGLLRLAEGEVLAGFRQNPLLVGAMMAWLAYTPIALVLWWRRLPRPRWSATSRRAAWAWRLAIVLAALGNWAFLVWDGR